MTYTSHGHQILGTIAEGNRPFSVARCGGPGICVLCSKEAAAEQNRPGIKLPKTGMRRFVVFRPSPPPEYAGKGTANPPNEPQYEGVVFSDGTVAVRWLTAFRSHSIWESWDDLYAVHGHPEYGTRVEWMDS